jgi:hypothetical protein
LTVRYQYKGITGTGCANQSFEKDVLVGIDLRPKVRLDYDDVDGFTSISANDTTNVFCSSVEIPSGAPQTVLISGVGHTPNPANSSFVFFE